jgi:hypothetical protein
MTSIHRNFARANRRRSIGTGPQSTVMWLVRRELWVCWAVACLLSPAVRRRSEKKSEFI